jgi:arginine exporter protein ArgO
MIGSITLLSAKFFAEIVKSLFKGNNEFTKFPVYLSGILVLSLGALQIHILNLGLKRFDQIIVIPAFSVVLEIFSIIIGIIYFQQYSNFDLAQSIMFPASIAFTFIGVYMIAKGKKEQQKEQIVNSNSSQNV